jgi:hydrogenase maturation protein HypF
LPTGRSYFFPLSEALGVPLAVDWQPALEEILADLRVQTTAGEIARAFHFGLAAAVAAVAARIGEEKVVLSGGCFQNAFLTEATIAALRRDGFTPYWHRMVPPNDGGLALGQAVWAAGMVERGEI